MTTRINLLDWRAERRKQQQKEFYIMLAGAFVLGAGVVYGGNTYYQREIDYQESRNELLRDEISRLEDRVKAIKDLKETKQQLIQRMEVIQDLQKGRPQIVHLFEQFVATLPAELYLTSIKESGERLKLNGVAISSSRVSDYMDKLEESPWLTNPVLNVVKVQGSDDNRTSQFTLSVEQTNPRKDDDGGSGS